MNADDCGLLTAARLGNEQAFTALYERHRSSLFGFVWRLTGSTVAAEDAVQECYLTLLKGAAFDSEQGSLRAYLFGIARNLALKKLRQDGHNIEESESTETTPGPLEGLLSAERSEFVSRAVGLLPPLQREALILFEYQELSLEQIAKVTGVEVGTVKARLHRARESLRQRLAPLMNDRTQKGIAWWNRIR